MFNIIVRYMEWLKCYDCKGILEEGYMELYDFYDRKVYELYNKLFDEIIEWIEGMIVNE